MDLPALNHLPLPIFICDASGSLSFTNELWQQQLRTPVGTSWLSVFPDLDDTHFQDLWVQCTQQNIPQRFSAAAVLDEDNAVWFDVVLQPLIDEQQQTLLLGALVDVTDRTNRVAEIQAILDTAVDAIITIDQDGKIEGFNQSASQMFGYAPEDVIDQNIRMLMPEPYRSAHDGYMRRYLQTGETRIIDIGRELTALDSAGREFPIYLAVSEIQVAGRRRFTGIVRDLTEQQASREALTEQREKLAHVGRLSTMGEMTASIAHEINQPLTAISMYAQAGLKLLERGGEDAKLKDAIEKPNVQALRAGAVIERIQRFAKSQEGVREIIDANDLVLDLMKLAESDARLHAMELTLDLAEELPQLYVDPIQIQQVALNLIRNAIDAMNEIDCRNGRKIIITSRLLTDDTGRDMVEIAVADLGPGVAEDQVDLLFTPFHTTKRDGMGMGLSICRSIISEHGGELNYLNNHKRGAGPGATFYFQLPVSADE